MGSNLGPERRAREAYADVMADIARDDPEAYDVITKHVQYLKKRNARLRERLRDITNMIQTGRVR